MIVDLGGGGLIVDLGGGGLNVPLFCFITISSQMRTKENRHRNRRRMGLITRAGASVSDGCSGAGVGGREGGVSVGEGWGGGFHTPEKRSFV